jgi:hypothetical protein
MWMALALSIWENWKDTQISKFLVEVQNDKCGWKGGYTGFGRSLTSTEGAVLSQYCH